MITDKQTNDPPSPFYADLRGKVAVVTGSSRGIGAATAKLLARNGVKVVVNGRDTSAIERVVNDISSVGGEALGYAADCTDAAALGAMREQVENAFGAVDILVAYAGGQGSPIPTVDISEAQWHQVIDLNLTAKFLSIKTFLPTMLGRCQGVIVLMSSSAGRLPSQASAAYACAEAGAIMLTKHLANEVGNANVRVNCVAPSAVRNERMEKLMSEEQLEQLSNQFPLGRIGEPEDIARATAFLVSAASSWITGATLDISGGRITV